MPSYEIVYDHKHVACFHVFLRSDGFHDTEIFVFENYKSITEFCLSFLFFVYLLPILTNEESHTTSTAFMIEGSF